MRIFIFFVAQSAIFFSPEFNIRLYDKNSESYYFFFLHQHQIIFFSNIGNQNIFLEKKTYPPPLFKLNDRPLTASGYPLYNFKLFFYRFPSLKSLHFTSACKILSK